MHETSFPAIKALFGRPLRVLLAEWILQRGDDAFVQTEAQDAMRGYNEAASNTRNELLNFAKFGLLSKSEVGGRVYYTPTDNPLWRAYAAIIDAIDEGWVHAG